MTTGSWDKSDPGLAWNDGDGDFLGHIEHKQWTGGDSSPTVKKPKKKRKVWITLKARVRRIPEGKPYYSKRLKRWVRSKGRLKLIPGRVIGVNVTDYDPNPAPKKLRSDSENSYSMSYVRATSELHAVDNGYYPDEFGVPQRTTLWYHTTQLNGGANVLGAGTDVWDANEDIRLYDKLRERLVGSDFDMSVFLGESHQTLRMIADSAIRIRKGIYHLRRGDINGTLRSLFEGTSRSPLPSTRGALLRKSDAKYAAQNWLELQYGWLPLLSDVKSGAEMMAHQFSVPAEKRFRVSRTVLGEGRTFSDQGMHFDCLVPPAFPWMQPSPGCPYYLWTNTEYRVQRTKRVTLYVKERPTTLQALGLTDPTKVAWELLPWSFVVDWFIPIGQWLNARGLSSIVTGRYVVSSKEVRWAGAPKLQLGGSPPSSADFGAKWKKYAIPGAPSGNFFPLGERPSQMRLNYSRSVSDEAPSVPLPTFKPLAKAASWQHCANALALLTTAFSKDPGHPDRTTPLARSLYNLGQNPGQPRQRPRAYP